MQSVYIQLKEKCLPIITSFVTDLTTHDRLDLQRKNNKNIPFLHFVYESATHLVFLHPHDSEYWPGKGVKVPYLFGHADRVRILTGKKEIVEYCANKLNGPYTCHYYDGAMLAQVNTDKAWSIIADYEKAILKKWNNVENKTR